MLRSEYGKEVAGLPLHSFAELRKLLLACETQCLSQIRPSQPAVFNSSAEQVVRREPAVAILIQDARFFDLLVVKRVAMPLDQLKGPIACVHDPSVSHPWGGQSKCASRRQLRSALAPLPPPLDSLRRG